MTEIGFSTGCLYKKDSSLDKKLNLFLKAGADAVELSFATEKELLEFSPSKTEEEKIRQFKRVSLHAPWKGDITRLTLQKMEEMHYQYLVRAVVFHPDAYDPETLRATKLPVLIENMDKRKRQGINAEYFKSIKKKFPYCYCFDMQHAYEQDSSLRQARRLIISMSPRIKQIHLSGETPTENHCPLHRSDNSEQIEELLKIGIDAPIILEGILKNEADAKNEVRYVRRLL